MALKRPPQHRVDAPAVFVHQDDSAWDNDRIKEECSKMRESGLDPSRHPVNIYHSGASRYDLGARYDVLGVFCCPADYLGPDAVRFNLKRMAPAEVYRLSDMGPSTATGRLYACRVSVESVDGPGPIVKRDAWGLTDESVAELYSWGSWLPAALGLAAYLASQPLTDDEKKH